MCASVTVSGGAGPSAGSSVRVHAHACMLTAVHVSGSARVAGPKAPCPKPLVAWPTSPLLAPLTPWSTSHPPSFSS